MTTDTIAHRVAVSLKLRLADAAELVLGRREPLIPPRRLRQFVGNSDFRATGEEFLRHFRDLADLQPSDRVLDIGCGIGRMARVLTGELRPPGGSYDGFDVDRDGISWCQRHYQTTPVPFRFTHVDIHHAEYNPRGVVSPATISFPYPDGAFDLAIATSVFTHLLEDVADHYLAEAARVLAPGGRLFATWFLIDPGRPLERTRGIVAFPHPVGQAFTVDPSLPESGVAYPTTWVGERLSQHGLGLRDPIEYGSWAGRPGRSSQDIIVADRLPLRAHPHHPDVACTE